MDRLSALPDDVLNHIVSFLPSDDAVRTSVLARRWRHLWRSTRALRLAARRRRRADWTPWSLNSFVNTFLLLRGGAPLDEFEIRCGEISGGEYDEHSGDDEPYSVRDRRNAELSRFAAPWIRHALSFCQARVLRLSVHSWKQRLRIADVLFASSVLSTVELAYAKLTFRSLDFSRCPALESLELMRCKVEVDRILSPSLRRLTVRGCDFHGENRTRISTPRVISLQLSVNSGRAPVLEKMPLLEAASVRFLDDLHMCHDICQRKSSNGDCGYGKCKGCYGSSCDGSSSVVLEGISGASELELASDPTVVCIRPRSIYLLML